MKDGLSPETIRVICLGIVGAIGPFIGQMIVKLIQVPILVFIRRFVPKAEFFLFGNLRVVGLRYDPLVLAALRRVRERVGLIPAKIVRSLKGRG